MSKILVTGANGFVGAHLAALLARRGHDVIGLARTGHGQTGAGVRQRLGDLLDADSVKRVLREERPDGLLHAAWLPVHGDVMSSPANWTFVDASLALFSDFAQTGGKRCAAIGSCAEYDWSAGLCQSGVTPLKPRSIYGAAKNALREQLTTLCTGAGLSLIWPRLFYLYGPGEHPSRLVAATIAALLDGRTAALSQGAQMRDYGFIGDVCEGVIAAFESTEEGPIDLATGQAVSIRRIAEEIAAQIGRADLLHFGARPSEPGEAPMVLGDAEPAAARLGWRAATTLADGVAQTIAAAKLARVVR